MTARITSVEPLESAMQVADPQWYKDAVIYQLHVKAFSDSNDDGIGDFKGLTSKLDYIQQLGVNTIWLLPFYPSPLKDDGYDVADYHNVHPQYGTRADFRNFVREAHKRNLRVITELVVNHTSDQHPWFQAARRAPEGSSKRNFYVWSNSDDKYRGTRIIFTDTEASNWAWDPLAKAYYWHRFFSHQPDLNFDNPTVLKAILRIMRFWLDMGVDGFRLDAIPYLVEREGTNNENLPETHAVIKQIRAALDARYQGRMFLAEANQWPEDVREYFGDDDECHMAYHFPLMPRIYMAIAQEDRHPVFEIMQQTPDIPPGCQWAIFLRNHDELTLEMVTSKERDYMYQMYAADQRARINLGIRRRLAPLMENDLDRIKLMNSILLSMPGSPIIYYGDEIGMGDNFFLGDRNGVRTPMQWSSDRNAGFSRADPQRLYLPPIMDAIYGYGSVNVEAQLREPASLLNWMRRMLATRNTSHAFGRGTLNFLKPGNRKILAYLREHDNEVILCVTNLARSAQPVELDLSRFIGRVPVEMFGRTAFPPIGELPYLLTLPASGFYWFRLATDVDVPHWHEDQLTREDLPVLVLFDGWTSFFRDRVVPWRIAMAIKTREQFETQIMPLYIALQRWFAEKNSAIKSAQMTEQLLWERNGRQWMMARFDVESGTAAADKHNYFVPLALHWEDSEEASIREHSPAAIAKVRQQAKVGILGDAFADENFCRALVEAIGEGCDVPAGSGLIRFKPTQRFADIVGPDANALTLGTVRTQGSNTAVRLGEHLFLKGYRHQNVGVNLEFEVGSFLSDTAHFKHCIPVAGTVEWVTDAGSSSLALLQAYIENEGDGWSYTMDYLGRHFADALNPGTSFPEEVHGAYLTLMRTLGRRTAELHHALTTPGGGANFDPEPVSDADIVGWKTRVLDDAEITCRMLADCIDHVGRLDAAARDAALQLVDPSTLKASIEKLNGAAAGQRKMRYHGDYHLGQVLLSENDFFIIDFEGEPARPMAERRAKHSPLKDVAGMLRSFDYACHAALKKAALTPEDEATCMPLAQAWLAQTRTAFLQGYAAASAEYDLLPDFPSLTWLLTLFEFEKALYELRYELNNRPGWVDIPLAGLLRLL